MLNKDELKGRGKRIKGRIKEKAGEILGNPILEAEGEVEQIEGAAQEGVARVRRKANELLKRANHSRKNKRQ
jgi:uncharacterized protein YjbJ (UPF0337 family)